MPENKNKISSEEWARRIRATQSGPVRTAPSSIRRTPANVSGSLAQLKSNLDGLNRQRLSLAMGNVATQYNLADRLAQATAEISANAIARKDQLYANRQANIDRMSQMYGQYYQQFGNVLNKEALDFLDQHSNIKVPTLTAIMAGYEHARASRAEQALAALDRTAKITEAEAQLEEKRVALENEKSASDLLLKTQQMDAQSKANQAAYEAQKAYLDEQARNEMLGAGLASTGRGTGVRALPGFGGGVGAGARAGVGRVPSAVTGARSGETVTGGAAPTGRVVQTGDGQTVAVDNNKNVIGTVVPTQNGSVVVNDNGQTVGSVDANGNVMPIAAEPQMGAYAHYQAAGGGGFWSNPGQNTLGAITSTAALPVVGAYAGALGESARLGYVSPEVRTRYNTFSDLRNLSRDAAREFSISQGNVRALAQSDPRFSSFLGPNRLENYVNSQRGLSNLHSQVLVDEYDNMLRLRNEASGLRNARNAYVASEGADAIRAARNAVTTADNAGAIARGTGTALRRAGGLTGGNWLRRGLTRVAPRVATRLGMTATGIGAPLAAGLTALDVANYGPYLAGGAVGTAIQSASNFWDYASGNYDRRVAEAIATGQPIPQRRSAFDAGAEMAADTKRGFWNWIIPGRTLENFGMANRDDVNNFSRFFKNITGVEPDYETKRIFDKLPDISRATILNGMLTNRDLTSKNLQAFIDDTIKSTSTPQEQQAIQQEIEQENRDARFERSTGSNGDHSGVKAVTEDIQNRLAKLGYDYTYDDVMDGADAYLDVLGWYETRNKAGAEGVPTKNGTAKSRWQLMDTNFDTGRKRILKKYGDKLSREDRDLLINAKNANDLDNEYGQPLLAMIVLDNVFEDLAINNEHLDKKGPNIRSDQMFGEIVGMVKMAREDGDVDDQGNTRLDPIILGNIGRLGGVVHMRATDQKNVGDWYTNVNGAINEFPGIGFRRNAQGGNDPWWDLSFTPLTRYGELRGRGAQTQAQRAGYGFDVAPGVDVDNLNTLLLQRFSAANDAMVSATGVKGRTNSGYRSFGKQTELYNNRANNPNPVGKPGWSFHQSGMALDFNNDEWEKAFNASDQLKHDYGTFDDFLGAFGLQRGVTDRNGKRSDLVHLTMVQDDEYHNTIDHDRLMASRGKWGDQGGNYWMRGVGSRPQQMQPAWDVSPQYMVENFGYPTMQYPATDYDPDLIFAGNQNGYVFDYDYDEDGNQIPY